MATLHGKINSSEMIERHSLDDDRIKQSLYLSQRLYKKFRRACGKASASRIMEELMRAFIRDVEDRAEKSKTEGEV